MGIPYEKTVDVIAAAGDDSFHEIAFPHRGELTKLIVVQVEGDLDGFEAELFNSLEVLPGSSSSSASGDHSNTAYVIVPTEVAGVGASEITITDQKFPYVNRDGTPTNPQRKLYLRVKPEGAGDKKFCVTLGVDQPII